MEGYRDVGIGLFRKVRMTFGKKHPYEVLTRSSVAVARLDLSLATHDFCTQYNNDSLWEHTAYVVIH